MYFKVEFKSQNIMTQYIQLIRYIQIKLKLKSQVIKSFIIVRRMIQQEVHLKEGLSVMGLEHLEVAKQVMAQAFLSNNQIWKSFVLNKDDILQFLDRTLRTHLQSQERSRKRYGDHIAHQFIYVRQGKVLSTIHHYELEDYKELQKVDRPEKLDLFKQLQKEGKELIKAVDLNAYAPGTAVYANFGGTDPREDVSSLMKTIIFTQYHSALKKSGFRWVITRVSNIKAAAIYEKIGAKKLKEISFKRNGKQFPLYFFEVDLNNETLQLLQKNLDKLIEKQRQAKLKKLAKL